MRVEALEKAWRDQAGAAPLTPVMAFGPEGLTLGAGTVLAAVETLTAGDDGVGYGEARLHALLSAAYLQSVPPQAIRYIRRGAVRWRDGDHAMAAMHLAMTGLLPLRNVKDAARRLFMADALMKAGSDPATILRALDLGGVADGEALTRYDRNQPRNPAGSGRVSGWWTREDAAAAAAQPAVPPRTKPAQTKPAQTKPAQTKPARTPPLPKPVAVPPPEAAGAGASAAEDGVALLTNPETFAALASLAVRFSAPTVFFSVLLTPSNRTTPDKIQIPGRPDMHLERGVGDRLWRLVYKDKAGVKRAVLQDDDGWLRTADGQIFGRIDPKTDALVVLRGAQATRARVAESEPRLCPAEEPDKPGQGLDGEARDYENRVKLFVNHPPTPNALAFYLPNPDARGGRVSFDDCHQQTGAMIEAKGPGYSRILRKARARLAKNPEDRMGSNAINRTVRQGLIQIGATRLSGNRPIVWFCHDQDTINYLRGRFEEYGNGLQNIKFFLLP